MLWALTRVPWRTILVHGPAIVDAARTLYARSRRPVEHPDPARFPLDDESALRRAVRQLEEREMQQAKLIADLAKQVQDLAGALEILAARIRLIAFGAALAVAVAIVSVVITLAR
ncbi:MAG: hypothetical protein FJ027_17185 [Candidatus Rokubacteria bacterium]|nr:hypothetical protein [Candidatus Rokubacteria bacterium]